MGEGGGEAQVEARFAKGEVNALARKWHKVQNDRRRAREGGRCCGGATQGDGRIRGPGGREGGREVEDWRMLFFFAFVVCRRGVAWLHGCTERKQTCSTR